MHTEIAHRRAWAVLWLGQFVAVAGLTVVVPLLPFYLAELGVSPGNVPLWTAIALAAPAVAQMLAGPLWGWVGDHCGRKAMVVRAQTGLALTVALMSLAGTPLAFLLCRLLQGACGGVSSALAAFASSLVAPERRGRGLGGLFCATAAGSLTGPLLGNALVGSFGFSALFLTVALLMAVSTVLTLIVLREPAAHDSTRPVRLSPRLGLAVLLGQTETRNFLLAGFLAQAGVYALMVVFAPRIAQIGESKADAVIWVGILQAITWGASLAGGPWWGRRHDLHSPRRGVVLATTACMVAVALQAVPADPAWMVPLRLAQGFCFASVIPAVLQVVSRVAPEGAHGACLGLATSLLDCGQVLGPLVGAAAVLLGPLPVAFVAISVLFGLSALLAALSRGTSARGCLPRPSGLPQLARNSHRVGVAVD